MKAIEKDFSLRGGFKQNRTVFRTFKFLTLPHSHLKPRYALVIRDLRSSSAYGTRVA